jgi:hypothetical protein
VTEHDEIDEHGEQFWELAGLTDRQIPEFGILAVSYIDVDGVRRFNWRVADALDGIEVEAMIDVLQNLARSIVAASQEVEIEIPNGLMDPGNPGDSSDT